jgi:hypothetical protein
LCPRQDSNLQPLDSKSLGFVSIPYKNVYTVYRITKGGAKVSIASTISIVSMRFAP